MNTQEYPVQPALTFFLLPFAHSYLNTPKPGWARTMTNVRCLNRFSFTAVGNSEYDPVILITDRITGIPKDRSHACIGWILQNSGYLTVFNFPGDLASELKVQSSVIDT